MFSIIVPIYNIEKYIEECINSILNQTYKEFELILVDDGSTDTSGKICDDFQKKDSRIKVIHKINGGLVSARKAGTLVAKNKYIVPIDGDDFIKKDYLKNAYDIIMKNDPDMICFSYTMYYENNSFNRIIHNNLKEGLYNGDLTDIINTYLYDENRTWRNKGNILYNIWAKIVKKDIYTKCQMSIDDKIKIGEDCLVTCKILKECSSMYIKNEAYYNYRQINTSMMKKFNSKNFESANLTYLELAKIFNTNNTNVFALNEVLDRTSDIISSVNNYKEFKKIYMESIKKYKMFEAAKNANIAKTNLKGLISISIIKKDYCWLLYSYLRRRKK